MKAFSAEHITTPRMWKIQISRLSCGCWTPANYIIRENALHSFSRSDILQERINVFFLQIQPFQILFSVQNLWCDPQHLFVELRTTRDVIRCSLPPKPLASAGYRASSVGNCIKETDLDGFHSGDSLMAALVPPPPQSLLLLREREECELYWGLFRPSLISKTWCPYWDGYELHSLNTNKALVEYVRQVNKANKVWRSGIINLFCILWFKKCPKLNKSSYRWNNF